MENLPNPITPASAPVRGDITTQADIERLVHSFYERVQKDELLRPIFEEVARVNWAEHLPHLCDFWSDLLLRTRKFRGQPWPKHAQLPVGRDHFQRWIALFVQTIDAHFSGPTAESAKGYAKSIADTFQQRLGLITRDTCKILPS